MSDQPIAGIVAELTDVEQQIVLASKAPSETDFPYLSFKHLRQQTGVDAGLIAPACRRLRTIGIMGFESGLRNDEGEPYGSGYALCDGVGVEVRSHLQALARTALNEGSSKP